MNRERLADVLSTHAVVRLAFLFGSVGEGQAGFESDLDVAVMGERALAASEIMALMDTLARLSGRPVDLVDLRETHGPLLGQILTKGTKLLCEDTTLYALLLKRHVFAQADWMPTATVFSASDDSDGSASRRKQTRIAASVRAAHRGEVPGSDRTALR